LVRLVKVTANNKVGRFLRHSVLYASNRRMNLE